MVAKGAALRLAVVEARHVTHRAEFDQLSHNRAAERAGAAADHNLPITKVHGASGEILIPSAATTSRARDLHGRDHGHDRAYACDHDDAHAHDGDDDHG